YVYAPHAGFVGVDSFGYVGIDHLGRSLPGTVQVEVAENCRPEITPDTKSLVCRYSVPKDLSLHVAPSQSALAGEFLAVGPWIFNGGADYVGYYENSSPAVDKADLAPSGTAVRTHAYRVDHDAANDRF